MKRKRFPARFLALSLAATSFLALMPVTLTFSAEEGGIIYTADQAEFIVNRYLHQERVLEEVLGDDSAISYWRCINGIQEDEKLAWAVEKSSYLVDEYPDKKDYVEILANLMTMQAGELAEQIEQQSQFDHLKSGKDYILQVADIAAGIAGGTGSKVYQAISPIVDAALGGGKLAVENGELAKYFEASIQDYTQSRCFLEAITEYGEDELLKETASALLEANDELLQRRLEYLGDSAEAIAKYEADFFLGHLYSDLLKETTLYQTDETVKWYVDGVEGLRQSLLSALGLGKAAFNLTILAGDLQYGTSATFNRYQEMRIVAEIAEAVSRANQQVSVSSEENPADVLDKVREKTDYYQILTAVHARGEYLIYQLLMEDAGMLSEIYSKLDLLRSKSAEEWYQGQTETFVRYETILDHMFDVPDDDDSRWIEAYRPVLEQYYTALMNEWTPEQCGNAGLCTLAAYEDPETLGYFLTDVDYDGTKELMIGLVDNLGMMYDFYTLAGDAPIQLGVSTEDENYYYCSGHEILWYCHQPDGSMINWYYCLQGGSLELLESLRYDSSQDTWLYRYEREEGDYEPMTQDYADDIQLYYQSEAIAFTPFAQWENQRIPGPFTEDELWQIALALGIPEEMRSQVQTEQGEPYYWEAGERWITSVEFYLDGQIAAGASVDSFTLEQCRNILRYSGPVSSAVSAPLDLTKVNGGVLAGNWRIDGERTMEESGASLTEIFGTGLQYGNNMRFERDGEFSYFAGIGAGGRGSWEIRNGKLMYIIQTEHSQDSETGELLVEEEEGDGFALVMDYFGYPVYWKKISVPDNAVSVDFQMNYDNGKEQGVLTARDSSGNPTWTYETIWYDRTELDRVNEIGIYGTTYYFVDGGVVKALYMTDGTIRWRNEAFGGSAAAHVFTPDQKLHLCGYYGPDFFVVDGGGNTVKRIEQFSPDSFWPSAMELQGDSIMVYMDQTPSENVAGYLVSLVDYSYEEARVQGMADSNFQQKN